MWRQGGSQPRSTSLLIALRIPDQCLPQRIQPSLSKEHSDRQLQDDDIGGSNASPAGKIGVKVLIRVLASDEKAEDRPHSVGE